MHKGIQRFTELNKNSRILTKPHRASKSFREPHGASQSLPEPHKVSQSLTEPHRAGPAVTMSVDTAALPCPHTELCSVVFLADSARHSPLCSLEVFVPHPPQQWKVVASNCSFSLSWKHLLALLCPRTPCVLPAQRPSRDHPSWAVSSIPGCQPAQTAGRLSSGQVSWRAGVPGHHSSGSTGSLPCHPWYAALQAGSCQRTLTTLPLATPNLLKTISLHWPLLVIAITPPAQTSPSASLTASVYNHRTLQSPSLALAPACPDRGPRPTARHRWAGRQEASQRASR